MGNHRSSEEYPSNCHLYMTDTKIHSHRYKSNVYPQLIRKIRCNILRLLFISSLVVSIVSIIALILINTNFLDMLFDNATITWYDGNSKTNE